MAVPPPTESIELSGNGLRPKIGRLVDRGSYGRSMAEPDFAVLVRRRRALRRSRCVRSRSGPPRVARAGAASRAVKDAALLAMADALVAATPAVLAANKPDVQAGRRRRHPTAMIDRLTLTDARIAGHGRRAAPGRGARRPGRRGGARQHAGERPEVRQLRVPFGVVGIVYEARPTSPSTPRGCA